MTDVSAPITEAAKQWNGWGTALKPALEPITMARKPLIGTVAANVLEHGTGGINVDGCRVGTEMITHSHDNTSHQKWKEQDGRKPKVIEKGTPTEHIGRFPANLIHDGSDDVVALFPVTGPSKATPRNNGEFKSVAKGRDLPHVTFGHDDAGGTAARFFYCAKASKRDRNEGCEGLDAKTPGQCTDRADGSEGLNSPRAGAGRTSGSQNGHPTVKPTDLMRYLCRLVTPPKGIVLDPFMGSGSTGKAALLEGFRFIGIERDAEYFKIAEARIQPPKPEAQGQFAL
jgi:site-specific DNA-methyltransferase (adenine-specific)